MTFEPGTAVESWENGFYDGLDGPAHEVADAIAFSHKLAAFYVQDQWRALANLAISLGLRYDLEFLHRRAILASSARGKV